MRIWRIAAWPVCLLLAQVTMAAGAENQAAERLPPFVPDGETITEDTALSENCLATVNDFIANYCQKYGVTEVYHWTGPNGDLSFGVLVSTGGVVKLYYITIQIR